MSNTLTEHGLQVEWKTITPDDARLVMNAENENYRKLCQNRIIRYRDALLKGHWTYRSGATMTFDTEGRLLDGQHRMQAIVDSGCDMTVLCIYGAKIKDTINTDTGQPRSVSQYLKHKGYSNVKLLSTVLRLLYVDESTGNVLNGINSQSTLYDVQTCEHTLGKNPDILRFITSCMCVSSLVSPTPVIYVTYRGTKLLNMPLSKALEATDRFVDGILNGSDNNRALQTNDARFLLRRRLEKNKVSKEKLPRDYVFALMIKAWNQFIEGIPSKTIRWSHSGKNTESFPQLITSEELL